MRAFIMETTLQEQHKRDVILANPLVANNQEIADRILQEADFISFKKDHILIEENDDDDTVYFIVKGSVEVRNSSRILDNKQAPDNVGEMAAKRAGMRRTATVIVSSSEAEFFALPGVLFRALLFEFPYFKENLEVSIDDMTRRKISQLSEIPKNGQPSWIVISTVVAALVASIVGILAWDFGLGWLQISLAVLGISVIAFVGMVLIDPELIYRNMARVSGYSIIALIFYAGLSFAVTLSGTGTEIPFLLKFNAENQTTSFDFVVSVITLLVVYLGSGYLDTRKKD